MATIDSSNIIKTILENDGIYPGDPQLYSVHTYFNMWGKRTYHVSMNENDEFNMYSSPYVVNPMLLWNREIGLTNLGKEMLEATIK